MNDTTMNDHELKLSEDLQAVIMANKKVNDASVAAVLNNLFHYYSPIERT